METKIQNETANANKLATRTVWGIIIVLAIIIGLTIILAGRAGSSVGPSGSNYSQPSFMGK